MATNSTKSDSGAIYGQTYDVTIDGYAYTLKTVDHMLNVSGIQIKGSTGLFKGGAYTVEQEKVSIEIDAITGIPVPSQLVVFSQAFHGFAAKYWMVGNLSLKSSNTGGRTYSGELMQSFASS